MIFDFLLMFLYVYSLISQVHRLSERIIYVKLSYPNYLLLYRIYVIIQNICIRAAIKILISFVRFLILINLKTFNVGL